MTQIEATHGRVYLTCSPRRESTRAEVKLAGEWGIAAERPYSYSQVERENWKEREALNPQSPPQ